MSYPNYPKFKQRLVDSFSTMGNRIFSLHDSVHAVVDTVKLADLAIIGSQMRSTSSALPLLSNPSSGLLSMAMSLSKIIAIYSSV